MKSSKQMSGLFEGNLSETALVGKSSMLIAETFVSFQGRIIGDFLFSSTGSALHLEDLSFFQAMSLETSRSA
jgi:hypothetical protein